MGQCFKLRHGAKPILTSVKLICASRPVDLHTSDRSWTRTANFSIGLDSLYHNVFVPSGGRKFQFNINIFGRDVEV